jgi:ABC-type glycerol-3-phosphate transport system permease component
LPLIYTINNAFKPLDELFYFPPRFFVRIPTLDNFSDLRILMSATWVPFERYVLNTLLITGIGTAGHILLASAAAFALAKLDVPFKKTLFTIVVLSLMFSGNVTAIPNYLIISALGWNNTYLAVIVPAFAGSLGLYLMRQFMEQIPDSLLESARIDGASEYQNFWLIIMPNVRPAWLTLMILMFQSLWGTTGGVFLRSEQLKPLSYALNQIVQGGIARAGAASAVGLILMSVPIILFIIVQSSIIETMASSGIKE